MFVAALPSAEAIEDLDAFLSVRRDAAALRWTDSEHWHLTLAFAAEVPERALDDLVEGLSVAVAKSPPITARISGGGAFPHAGQAKVLWAGVTVDDPDVLEALAVRCRHAVTRAGAPVAGERFRPHMTVARMPRPVEATRWIRVLESYSGPEFALDRVALFASYLGQGRQRRPRHEVVEVFEAGPRFMS